MPLRVDPRRDRKLNRLVKAAELRGLRLRQLLYQAGDPAEDVYLVRSGFVRLVAPSNGPAGERTVALVGPWEIVGDEGLVGGGRRYRCLGGEASTYQALPGAGVFHVLKSTRRTFAALVEGYAGDLETSRHLSTGSPGPSAAERLARVLLDLVRRWGTQEGKGVLLSQRITHQVLGDLAGAHRSTVTTTLNDWIYQGWIAEARRGLLITSPLGLERLAGQNRVLAASTAPLPGPPPVAAPPGRRVVDPFRARR